MQVMGDMLERIIQASAQQSAASVPQQTATSEHKPVDELASSAANGGANSNPLTPILPGTIARYIELCRLGCMFGYFFD